MKDNRIYQKTEGLEKGIYCMIEKSTSSYVKLKHLATGNTCVIPKNYFKRYYEVKYKTHTINVRNDLFNHIKKQTIGRKNPYIISFNTDYKNPGSIFCINYKFSNNIKIHNVIILKNKEQETLYFNVLNIVQDEYRDEIINMNCMNINIR